MQPFFEQDNLSLYCGDLPRRAADAAGEQRGLRGDGPALRASFMEKDWDHDVPGPEYWRAIARVCKPGALLLGLRRHADLSPADLRDRRRRLGDSGLPDVALRPRFPEGGRRRQDDRQGEGRGAARSSATSWTARLLTARGKGTAATAAEWPTATPHNAGGRAAQITAPATAEAAKWTGWAAALKPAWEPIVLAMKPMDGTQAHNALAWGVAGMNIDAARIGENPGYKYNADRNGTTFHGKQGERIQQSAAKKGSQFIESTKGRWPANLLLGRRGRRPIGRADRHAHQRQQQCPHEGRRRLPRRHG